MNVCTESGLAVVIMAGHLLEVFLTKGTGCAKAIHGVRDITIVDVEYDKTHDNVVLLVHSKDIPAYVAFNKISGTLRITAFREENYPELVIVFEQEIQEQVEGDRDNVT